MTRRRLLCVCYYCCVCPIYCMYFKMGNCFSSPNAENAQIKLFLFHRGVFNVDIESFSDFQKAKVKHIMQSDSQSDSEILSSFEITNFDQEFLKFLGKSDLNWQVMNKSEFVDESKIENSKSINESTVCSEPILFWDFYADVPGLKILRRQLDGLCHITSAVVFQHYLVAIYTKELTQTVDVNKYIYRHLCGKPLKEYILNDAGSDSVTFFRELCVDNCVKIDMFTIPPDDPSNHNRLKNMTCESILDRLKVGPALISGFMVDKRFQQSSEVSFISSHNKVKFQELVAGRHSMILIGGIRRTLQMNGDSCTSCEYYFLLQNTWKDRYFIEVSADYLRQATATINFVSPSTPVTEIPINFPTDYYNYAETSLDKAESFLDTL